MSRPESHILADMIQELRRLFKFECPVILVEGVLTVNGIVSRGGYSFNTRTIRISSKQSPLQMVETLCHEIVHHKQQCHKIIGGTGEHWWYRGKWYPKSTPYKDQPWEIEANTYMSRMFSRFVEKASRSLLYELQELEHIFHQKNPKASQRACVKELEHV